MLECLPSRGAILSGSSSPPIVASAMALYHVQDRLSGNHINERGSLALKSSIERESFLRLSAPLLQDEEEEVEEEVIVNVPRDSEKSIAVPYASLRGVYAHYVALGWLNGIAISTAFAYCYYGQGGSANTCTALPSFFQLAWSFKFVLGAVQDATPLGGLRRAPYVVGGWSVCCGLGAVLAVFADDLSMLGYAGLVCGLECFMVTADTACDALVVGLTKVEGEDVRGSILANAYSCRFSAAMLSSAAIAVLYDGKDQGGTMPFALSLRTWWAVGVAPAAVFLLTGTFNTLKDAEKALIEPEARPSVAEAFGQFRECLKRPAAHRVGVALFVITSLSLVTNSASNAAAIQWFGYSNLQYGVDNTMSYVTLTVVLQLLKAYALRADWRALFGGAIFTMQAFYATFLLVVWLCWARNGWFYVFLNIDNQVAYDVTFFLSVVMVPELVEPGLEGVTYGAFTTLTNAAQNVAGAISVQLLGIWTVSNAVLKADTHQARANVTKLQVLCCLVGCAAIPFTLLLPSQKDACARLRQGPSKAWMADAVLVVIVLGMIYGVAMSVLPIVPATACLKLVGGSGCGAAADDDAAADDGGVGYCG